MTGSSDIGLSDSIDDGKRPLSTPFTTLLSTSTVLNFLDRNIPGDTELIISTVRKGSWIIEDYIRRRRKHLRNITSSEPFPEQYKGAKIVLFDDSIHSGKTIEEQYRKILDSEDKADQKLLNVTVCCIAINEDALRRLNKIGIDDVRYLKLFNIYEKYVIRNNEEKELAPDCQSYYYSHFIVPYISGLSFNYSPDYKSISILIEDNSSDDLEDVMKTVLNTVKDCTRTVNFLYKDTKTIRESAELTPEFSAKILKKFYTAPSEIDMGKIRVSATSWDGTIEIVITPIVSYRITSENDLKELLVNCSDEIITQVEDGIVKGLEDKGYKVLSKNRFQADKGTGWGI